MGWWTGEEDGMERDEERDKSLGEIRGEALEAEEEGVVGGVGKVILDLGLSVDRPAVAVDELDNEEPGLRVVGGEGLGFELVEVLGENGSMALRPEKRV